MAGWAGGVFTRARNWVADKSGAINPQAALFDQEDDNFATGLNNCVTKDGLNKPTATMDWNAQRLTALADATVATDAVNRQFGDGRYARLGAANAFTGVNTNTGQPLFMAQRVTSTQSMPASAVTTILFNGEYADSTSAYDGTTGIFTCATFGYYLFTAVVELAPAGTNCVLNGIYFSRNNATAVGTSRVDMAIGVRAAQYSSSGNNVVFGNSAMFALGSTDTVRIKWDAGTSGASTNGAAIGSTFQGYLIA